MENLKHRQRIRLGKTWKHLDQITQFTDFWRGGLKIPDMNINIYRRNNKMMLSCFTTHIQWNKINMFGHKLIGASVYCIQVTQYHHCCNYTNFCQYVLHGQRMSKSKLWEFLMWGCVISEECIFVLFRQERKDIELAW